MRPKKPHEFKIQIKNKKLKIKKKLTFEFGQL